MPQQTVPDIDFDKFVIAEIATLFDANRIKINLEYQRGDIWTYTQQIDLIESINKRYSIGVLVLFVNEDGQFEILDGQQRLLTLYKYVSGQLNLKDTEIESYSDLSLQERTLLDAYCVYYLKLKSHDPETREEDIVQTFLRLQEGTPLNKAEKINAYRGAFKEAFREAAQNHPLFKALGKEKRFRFRQLAAELLTIEIEGDLASKVLPSLDQATLISVIKKNAKHVSSKKLKFFRGNLDFMSRSLSYLLTGFKIREVVSFYMLISYLRSVRAGNMRLQDEVALFAGEFLKRLNSFSIYDDKSPSGMEQDEFDLYRRYKQESKLLTTPGSLKARLEIMLDEFDRIVGQVIVRDPIRFHDVEQRRILFFRQQGLCGRCSKPLNFKDASSHHLIAHRDGGQTANLDDAVLLHERCHVNLEAELTKKRK